VTLSRLIKSGIGLCAVALLLSGCAQGYKNEHGQWAFVFWNEGNGRQVESVKQAEAASFEQLKPWEYARDKNHVYWRGDIIASADPRTFEHVAGRYTKDNQHVFIDQRIVKDADPATFQKVHGEEILGRDKNDFYYGDEPFHVLDAASFEMINDGWAKDSRAYYAYGYAHYIRRADCDYMSMKILNGSWAKDKNRAYYQGIPIEGVDVNSFRVTGEFSAIDNHRAYDGPGIQSPHND